MFRRLFGGKKKRDIQTIKAEYLEQVNKSISQGVTRQALNNEYLKMKFEIHDPEFREKIKARDLVVRELGGVMLDRNMKGKELENAGNIDEAIPLYEANLIDQFMGTHPYERLRIIYRSRKDYENAIRVCQSAIDNPHFRKDKKPHFQKWIDKMR